MNNDMIGHERNECDRMPYTAYFSMDSWSWRDRRPVCGAAQRQILNKDGRGAMFCNGVKIEQASVADI